MKKIAIFSIVFLVIFSSASIFAKNLLSNSGFEEIGENGKPKGGWVLWGGFRAVQDVSFKGNRSMYTSVREGASGIRFDQLIYNIVGGKKYYTSAWIRSSSKAEVYFKTEWYDSGGKFCGGVDSPHFFTAGNDKWQKFSWEHEAPIEASAQVRVLFRTKGPGDVWFDEVYFGDEQEEEK